MGRVASGANRTRVIALFVQLGKIVMAGLAVEHGLDFSLPKMACLAFLRHHRSRDVNSVARNTVQRGPVACPVAKVTKDPFMRSLQRPGMPRLCTCRRRRPERKERTTLGRGVAYGACAGEHLARLIYVAIVMASETTGPVAVANVIGISRPVYFHGWEDITAVNPEDSCHRPIKFGFLIREGLRVIFCIVAFEGMAHLLVNILLIPVFFDEGIQGQFFDPGQFG